MKLALYKGPGKTLLHKALHRLICRVSQSHYSHCELVIDGICYTSSNRDGGVRGRAIDLTSGSWDVVDVPSGIFREDAALAWFMKHQGERYDWIGVARFVLPFLPVAPNKWFCSEACAAALGLRETQDVTPQDLLDFVTAEH